MPAHLFYGDSFLVSQALTELQGQVGPLEVLEANSHRISGAEIVMPHLQALCNSVPFLAERRLVIVEGLLSLFDPRERRRRAPTSPSRKASSGQNRKPSNAWGDLPSYIAKEMPPTTLLVFLDEKVSGGNTLFEKLRPVVQVRQFPTLRGEGLARWIRNRISDKGASISPGAIRLLSQLVGGDLWIMDNELEKLTLYVGDKIIDEKAVGTLVYRSRESSIFSAVDSLLEGKSAAALKMMHSLRNEGAELPYIVSMAARQLRMVTVAKDLMDRGHREAEIGERLGITRDFVVTKTIEQARKHSWNNLEWLYGRLMNADLAVKQGRMDQDVALELLVTEASKISARSGPGAHRSYSSQFQRQSTVATADRGQTDDN